MRSNAAVHLRRTERRQGARSDVRWNGVLCRRPPRSGLAFEGAFELVQVVVVVPG
jgi:hypothetical protein